MREIHKKDKGVGKNEGEKVALYHICDYGHLREGWGTYNVIFLSPIHTIVAFLNL